MLYNPNADRLFPTLSDEEIQRLQEDECAVQLVDEVSIFQEVKRVFTELLVSAL